MVSVKGVAFKTLVSVVLVVRSERFSFSSTKYGPTVSSGVNTHDAVVPEVVVPEADPLVELAEVLLLPQPLSAATPAPPRILGNPQNPKRIQTVRGKGYKFTS
jgi:hypothetical protein